MRVIYGLIDASSLELRYIGKTTRCPEERLKDHSKSKRYVGNWIRSLSSLPCIVILEKDPLDINEAEKRWISEMREIGARLTNVSDGGEGNSGLKHSIDSRMKMSKSHTGLKQTKEHIEARVVHLVGRPGSMLGRKHSEETKQLMSDSQKNSEKAKEGRLRAWTPERRAVYSERARIQILSRRTKVASEVA